MTTWFESMDFGAEDPLLDSPLWFEDTFCVQEFQNLVPSTSCSSSSSSFSCLESLPQEILQSLSSELQNQNAEMDHFLQLQTNRMRRSILEEERRKQTATMQRYESRINALMLQREEEITKARNKTKELHYCLKVAEMEASAWERAAKEREATAIELNHRLNRAREREADDTASFFHPSSSSRDMDCKVCHAGISCCVVFFPCKHICCCSSCEPLLEHCPLCATVKEASLQVFLP